MVGGSVESLKVIMNAVKERYDISLITPGRYELEDEKIKHIHHSKYTGMKEMIRNPFAFCIYYIKMLLSIRKLKPKVIHTQEQIGYFAVAFFKRLRLIDRSTILIHTERGLYEKYSGLVKKLFLFSLRYTDKVVVTTDYNKVAWSNAVDKNSRGKYVVIENTAGARFENYDISKVRRDDDSITVGFAGRLSPWKGWDLAEEICNSVATNKKIKFRVAMGCDSKKDKEIAEHIFETMGNKLQDRFTGNINLNLSQMDDFYYGIDVFIITSKPKTESFGRVLVEAMSRKVVVLGTDCGGATEVIGKKDNILNTAEEFKKKLEYFLENRQKLNEESEYYYKRFWEKYSLENNADKHMKLYSYYL